MRSPTRLLVVDMTAGDVAVLRTMLATVDGMSFDLSAVASEDAANALSVERCDALLVGRLDLHSSTKRLLKRLRSVTDDQPIIMCAEFSDELADDELAAAGVDAVLPKTVWSPEILASTINFSIEAAKQRHQQQRDPLTGLANRAVWADRLHHAIERSRRSGESYAVLAIDVDDFKAVNDSLGHDGGDAYLREIADRIRATVREQDTVARRGGDEFLVLLEGLARPEAALPIAEKLIAAVGLPVSVERSIVPVTISIGVSVAGGVGRELSAEWVEKSADAALYRSKRAGKNRLTLFTDDLDAELLAAFEYDERVITAVDHDDFSIHYQPIVDLTAGALEGFEALLRWEAGSGQGESPSTFVPVLERLGLMDAVGRRVFSEAIDQLGKWRRVTGHELSMHVNFSAAQVVDVDFIAFLVDALRTADVPARALVIELTESMLFEHHEAVTAAFAKLRELGTRFSIDDFGTGYNSLVNLKRYRPDEIKIDGEFVMQIADSPVDMAIVKAQAVLAESLGMAIVAECVESDQQLLALRDIGTVPLVQGFHFGRPMSARAIEDSFHPFRRLVARNESTVSRRKVPKRAGSPRIDDATPVT